MAAIFSAGPAPRASELRACQTADKILAMGKIMATDKILAMD